MKKRRVILSALISALPGFGELTMPSVFSDHMVLQREQLVPVWGDADPGQTITVEFAGQIKSTVAGLDGKWRVTLDSLEANSTPQELTVSTLSATQIISDVLVGEVWFCSGQSNMEMELSTTGDAANAIIAAEYPLIRVFDAVRAASVIPADLVEAQWIICSPQVAGAFSGVAYYFGRKLHQDLNVPIGLLTSAWGGTKIEWWTPACGFEGIDSLAYILAELDHPPSPDVDHLQRYPTTIFNGMIHESIPYAIRGSIWYQGESNITDGMLYVDKTKALLNGWRSLWGTEFPFYFVQIAPFNDKNASDVEPRFWEAQSEIVRQIPNTGMAVISDVATLDNIHPPNKEVPGTRLALLAEAKTYGMDVVSSGPVFRTLEKLDGSLKVNFDSADGLTTRDGLAPDWFEIAGENGVFWSAAAEIEGSAVILNSPAVSNPCSVRFAWSKLAMPNLMNGAGLPAPAFRYQGGGGLYVRIMAK